jgi:hypothetical protein
MLSGWYMLARRLTVDAVTCLCNPASAAVYEGRDD